MTHQNTMEKETPRPPMPTITITISPHHLKNLSSLYTCYITPLAKWKPIHLPAISKKEKLH